MDTEVSIHSPYEIVWRRLFVSYDAIVEVTSRNLKIPISLYEIGIKAKRHVFKSKYDKLDYFMKLIDLGCC